MLGNTPGLGGNNIGFSYGIQQGGFSVVNVSHYSYHTGPYNHVLGPVVQILLHLGLGVQMYFYLNFKAEIIGNDNCRIRVYFLIYSSQNTKQHELLDQLGRAFFHFFRQFLDGYCFTNYYGLLFLRGSRSGFNSSLLLGILPLQPTAAIIQIILTNFVALGKPTFGLSLLQSGSGFF